MLERGRGIVERDPAVERQIVDALGERQDAQSRSIEVSYLEAMPVDLGLHDG